MVRIVFPTDSAEWHRKSAERMWASRVGDGFFRLENTPLYAYGVSYQDVVKAKRGDDGSLVFDGVESRSGHSTYQLLLTDGAARDDFDRLWRKLEALGCRYDSSRDPENVFGVDVPPQADVYAAYAILEEGRQQGVWEFGEGHCGHQLKS